MLRSRSGRPAASSAIPFHNNLLQWLLTRGFSSRAKSDGAPPPRPVGHSGTIQCPPHDDRLKRQPRSMIEPAAADVMQIDAVQRMFEIRRPDAKRVDGHRNAR